MQAVLYSSLMGIGISMHAIGIVKLLVGISEFLVWATTRIGSGSSPFVEATLLPTIR